MDTRQKMIDGAVGLMRVDGFNATSFKDVWEHTDTPRGSVYFHFPGGKEELGLEVIARTQRYLVEQARTAGAQTRTPAALVRRLAHLHAERLETSGYRDGCPLAAVALEMASSSQALRAAADDGFIAWTEAIADELERKGIPAARARDAAELVVSTLEGALMLSKTRAERAPLDRAGELLAAAVR